jgi:hypothetical protein
MNNRFALIAAGLLWIATSVTVASAVTIINTPSIESADSNSAIIRWTTDTQGTSVVHYGTTPRQLTQNATSRNRWNRSLGYMVHRVQVLGLSPGTTYYFQVESDGSKSSISSFSTPRPPATSASAQ